MDPSGPESYNAVVFMIMAVIAIVILKMPKKKK